MQSFRFRQFKVYIRSAEILSMNAEDFSRRIHTSTAELIKLKKTPAFQAGEVYQDSIAFRMRVRQLTKKYFPSEEKYVLTDQAIRAANSIVLGIAEGADRSTDRDFALFLNRSHTSLCEVVSCLDIALAEKYITKAVYDAYFKEAQNLSDQLTAFRRRLLLKPSK